MAKTGHLVHESTIPDPGNPPLHHLLYYEPLPDTVRTQRSGSAWHPRAGGFYFRIEYGSSGNFATFPNRTCLRQDGQSFYMLFDPQTQNGSWYGVAVMLAQDGFWYCYNYVGPATTVSKLRAATQAISWQTSTGRIYNDGGLPTQWEFVVIRSRCPHLFGAYRFSGAIAYHSYASVSTSVWNYIVRSP